jgi:hypothetical protein
VYLELIRNSVEGGGDVRVGRGSVAEWGVVVGACREAPPQIVAIKVHPRRDSEEESGRVRVLCGNSELENQT